MRAVLVVDAEHAVAACNEQPVSNRREDRLDGSASDADDVPLLHREQGRAEDVLRLGPGRELGRLQRTGQACRGVRRDAGERLGRQLPGMGTASLRARGAALDEREDGDGADDNERDERCGDE